MYLTIKILFIACFLNGGALLFGQDSLLQKTSKSLELGIVYATAEADYSGVYCKYNLPITKTKNHFFTGIGITTYFDFTGESEPNAELENDVDMRLIPAAYLGYNYNYKRFDFALEIPLGISIAITKGKLVNMNIGFEQTYSNTEYFLHFGIGFSTKYQLNTKNKIGFYGFYPLVKDIAWTLPSIGLGWTKNFNN